MDNYQFDERITSSEGANTMTYIEKIKDEKLRKAVLSVYSVYGYKLHFIPASLTGRHHPKDEKGLDGLRNHVEKVCVLLDWIASEYQFSDEIRDILYTAAYFHDLGKLKQTTVQQELEYRENNKVSRKVKVTRRISGRDLHPILGARLAREYLIREGVKGETVQIIQDLIARHMAHWIRGNPKPETELEKLFALADFIVSRNEFQIGKKEGIWSKVKKYL